MAKNIPSKLIMDVFGSIVEVEQKSLKNSKGYWDPDKLKIVIEKEQSPVEKWTVLIHEYIHAFNDSLIAQDVVKRRWNHTSIEYISFAMLVFMTTNHLSTMISIDELKKYLEARGYDLTTD